MWKRPSHYGHRIFRIYSFFLNLTSGNSCSSKFYRLSVQMVSKPCPCMLQLPKKDKICKSCTCETFPAKHSSVHATLEEKGGEWEENGESKAESSLETDALRVFTKTTIQEENSILPGGERGRRVLGCSPWAPWSRHRQAAFSPSRQGIFLLTIYGPILPVAAVVSHLSSLKTI